MKTPFKFTLIFIILLTICSPQNYNTSLCTDIEIGNLHYYINSNSNNQNLINQINSTKIIYNLCKKVEVYCSYLNAVVTGSMVVINTDNNTCKSYTQSSVGLIDPNNISSGITVTYLSQQNESIVINTPCTGN